jgi:hypothetical protein
MINPIKIMFEKLGFNPLNEKCKQEPSIPHTPTRTPRSLELFVKIMTCYPIAKRIASNLNKVDVLNIPMGIPALQESYFAEIPAGTEETVEGLLARSGSMKTIRQEGFRALTEGVTQYVLGVRGAHIEEGEYDFTDVFRHTPNFKRVPAMRTRNKLAFLESSVRNSNTNHADIAASTSLSPPSRPRGSGVGNIVLMRPMCQTCRSIPWHPPLGRRRLTSCWAVRRDLRDLCRFNG